MMLFNIQTLIVVVFLLLTFIVGLYFSKKITTLREYAVGSKQFATATLVATVLATNYGGGGLIREVEKVHKLGLIWIVFLVFDALCIWVISQLAIRMGPFMQHLSMPESIGSVYGIYPRIVAALSGICRGVCSLAIQIIAMSKAISMCIDSVDPRIVTILAACILVFYSTLGGIRAVTFTDVLQFITFAVIIPLLTWFMFNKIDKPAVGIIPFLQHQEKFQFSTFFHLDTELLAIVLLVISHLVYYIKPTTIQKVYMSSNLIQAKKVFLYATIFSLIINIFILFIGLFVFIGAPDLPEKEVWSYIMSNIPPFFKGFLSISLLAMTMSTADSYLNICTVMVSYDVLQMVQKIRHAPYNHSLKLARLSALILGLCAVIVAFYYNDLLKLMFLAIDFSVPIVTAPFILALFGFRATSRTALIGMTTGVITILGWNKWIEPLESKIGLDGSFFAMIANGFAMIFAHYLLPQPPGKGWIASDDEFNQIKQAAVRKKARSKESLRDFLRGSGFDKIQPSGAILVCFGFYIIVTTLLTIFISGIDNSYWSIFQLALGAIVVGYATFYTQHAKSSVFPLYWLIGLIFLLPINIFWHWYYMTDPLFTLALSLAHLAVALFLLPLSLGIGFVVITLLTCLYPVYCIGVPLLWNLGSAPLLLLGFSMITFTITIYSKHKVATYLTQYFYLKKQQKRREEQNIKELAYGMQMHEVTARNHPKDDSTILEQVIEDVTQAITFLDSAPLYKQDFQSIINKFSEWAIFLKKQAKSRDHILLLPTAISLEELIDKLEIALEGETGCIPRLLVVKKNNPYGSLPEKIVCDIHQIIDLLVWISVRIVNPDALATIVKIELYATHLKYDKSDPSQLGYISTIPFPSIAFIVSNSHTPRASISKIKSCYTHILDDSGIQQGNNYLDVEGIDISARTIQSIVYAHYGYLELTNKNFVLLVLPWDVTTIRDEMLSKLPMDCLTSETLITPKEELASIMFLMEFHDYVCQVSESDAGVIAEILLLLRRCYGFTRHPSGQLFYVRSVGIAYLVAKWVPDSPKLIYATLLYDLVRYTRLPLSYIKANYNLGIFSFVQNILAVDTQQKLVNSLFYISNRFKQAISKSQLSVLYIKLAERLYDLRHAESYTHLEEVKYMAKETLEIDVHLARKYFSSEPDITKALEEAAQYALKVCKNQTVSS